MPTLREIFEKAEVEGKETIRGVLERNAPDVDNPEPLEPYKDENLAKDFPRSLRQAIENNDPKPSPGSFASLVNASSYEDDPDLNEVTRFNFEAPSQRDTKSLRAILQNATIPKEGKPKKIKSFAEEILIEKALIEKSPIRYPGQEAPITPFPGEPGAFERPPSEPFKLDQEKISERLGTFTKYAMKAVSFTEAKEVDALAETYGIPWDKEAPLENRTFTNLFLNMGMGEYLPDIAVKTLGLAAGMIIVPETLFTFGVSPIVKAAIKAGKFLSVSEKFVKAGAKGKEIGTLTRALSDPAMTGVNTLIKARKDARVSDLIESGAKITDKLENRIVRQETEAVTRQMQNYGNLYGLEAFKGRLNVDKAIREGLPLTFENTFKKKLLAPDFFDLGGIKIAGKTVLNGEDLAKAFHYSGAPQLIKFGTRVTETLIPTTKEFAKEKILAPIIEPIIEEAKEAKIFFTRGKDVSIPGAVIRSGGEVRVLTGKDEFKTFKIIEEAKLSAERAYINIAEDEKKLFKTFPKNVDEKKFFETMLNHRIAEEAGKIEKGLLPNFGDAKVNAYADDWMQLTERLAKYHGLKGSEALKYYMPIVTNKQIKEIKAGASFIGDKILEGKFAERPFLERIAIEAAERPGRIRGVLKNPKAALTFRRIQVAQANIQDAALTRLIDEFGAELGKASKDGTFLKSYDDALAKGFTRINTKPYLSRLNVATLTGNVEELATAGKDFFIPKHIKNEFEKAFMPKGGKIPFITPYTTAFKRGVTLGFGGFHRRNWFSNIIQNSLIIGRNAFNPKLQRESWDLLSGRNLEKKIIEFETGEKKTMKALLDEAKIHKAIDTDIWSADITGAFLNEKDGAAWSKMFIQAMNPIGENFIGVKIARKIENQAKLVNYLAIRKKGIDPRAAKFLVDQALFDYKNVSNTHRYLKTAFIFGTWHVKNFELMMRASTHNPAAMMRYFKFRKAIGLTPEEMDSIPEYTKKETLIKLQTKSQKILVRGLGLPQDAFWEMVDNPDDFFIGLLNPLPKVAAELKFDKQFLTGRPLHEVINANEFRPLLDAYENPETPAYLKIALKPMVSFLGLQRDVRIKEGIEQERIIANPTVLALLSTLFTTRWQSTLRFTTDEERSNYETLINYLTGFVRIPESPDYHAAVKHFKSIENLKKEAAKVGIKAHLDLLVFPPDPDISNLSKSRLNSLMEKVQTNPQWGLDPQDVEDLMEEIKGEFGRK